MSTAKSINAHAILESGGKFEPYTYEVDDLKNNEVEMDVLHCGICHSDLSMVENEWGISKYPLVAGHEIIGKVTAWPRARHGCRARLAQRLLRPLPSL
jgi:uncharacterized zinc-type alcohol dehydrogenase-like protein